MAATKMIILSGDVDMNRIDDLRAEHAAFRESTADSVLVDLTGVTFFGSEGAGLLARLHRVAQQRGGTVTVVNASAAVMRVVEICGLRDMIRQEGHLSPTGVERAMAEEH